jgi:predicted hotdog family 3-hydroxylacyl-ACP dehydratase
VPLKKEETLNLTDINVADLLPQKPPFIMIDRLTYYDARKAVTQYTVRADSFFTAGGRLEEAGLVENIAQTCAARTGYEVRTQPASDGSIKIGMIGAIKGMTVYRSPRVGEQLETSVEILHDIFSTSVIEACVTCGGERIATCGMKIFLTDINAE